MQRLFDAGAFQYIKDQLILVMIVVQAVGIVLSEPTVLVCNPTIGLSVFLLRWFFTRYAMNNHYENKKLRKFRTGFMVFLCVFSFGGAVVIYVHKRESFSLFPALLSALIIARWVYNKVVYMRHEDDAE